MPPTSSYNSTALTPRATSSSDPPNVGLIVGIVVGAIILVLVIGGVIVSEVLRRRRKSRRPAAGSIVDFFKVKSDADPPDTSSSFGSAPLLYPPSSPAKVEEFNPYSNVEAAGLRTHQPSSPDADHERRALLNGSPTYANAHTHSRTRSVSDSTFISLPPPIQHAPVGNTHIPEPTSPQHSPWSSSAFMQESSPISASSSRTMPPRLTIPGSHSTGSHSKPSVTATSYAARHPVATVEETATPASAAAASTSAFVPEPEADDVSESSCSAYSQTSASTRQRRVWEEDTASRPPVPHIPERYCPSFSLSERTQTSLDSREHREEEEQFEGPEANLGRSSTKMVAQLLKARARRGGKPLSRSSTTVSRIERAGSIRSIAGNGGADSTYPDDDHPTSMPNPYNSSHPMETVTELPSAVSMIFPNPFQSALSSRTPSVSTTSMSVNANMVNMPVAPSSTGSVRGVEMLQTPHTPIYSQVSDHEDVKSLRPDEVVTTESGAGATAPMGVRPLNVIRKARNSSISGPGF